MLEQQTQLKLQSEKEVGCTGYFILAAKAVAVTVSSSFQQSHRRANTGQRDANIKLFSALSFSGQKLWRLVSEQLNRG